MRVLPRTLSSSVISMLYLFRGFGNRTPATVITFEFDSSSRLPPSLRHKLASLRAFPNFYFSTFYSRSRIHSILEAFRWHLARLK